MDSSIDSALDRIENGGAEEPKPTPPPRVEITPPHYFVPGFVAALVDYMMRNAPVPNLPAAFAGALAFLSLLAGRKYLGANGAFPILFLILMGESGCGKNYPREVISRLAYLLGISDGLIGGFASGAGLIDALRERPLLLSLYDECQSLFASLAPRGADAALAETKSAALKTIFTSAGSSISRDVVSTRSGKDSLPRTVRAPHFTLFGTGTPEEVIQYISPEMLGDGLAGRMLFIEADRFTGSNLDAEAREAFPDEILNHARTLIAGKTDGGALDPVATRETFDTDHDFTVVQYAPGGREAWRAYREECDARRVEIGRKTDALSRGRAGLFAREVELAGKCALLYALSESADKPAISPAGIKWAAGFVRSVQSAMFRKVADNFGKTPEAKAASKILARLRDFGGEIGKAELWRALRGGIGHKKDYDAALDGLLESGEIEETTIKTATKPKAVYRLVESPEGDA